MTVYDNTNRGTLGRNKRKEKESQPEYSGKLNVEGVEYWLSGWVKQGNGERFFSLSVKRKDPKPENVEDVETRFRSAVEEKFGRDAGDAQSSDIPF